MIKVLIVDDSFFVRKTLSSILSRDKDIEIVGTAGDGLQALEMLHTMDPDIITLDIEMPRMDGLTALKKIMAENPCPVIMLSSLTKEGADVSLQALEYGALDYMPKPGSFSLDVNIEEELITKVKLLSRKKTLMRLMHKKKSSEQAPALHASLSDKKEGESAVHASSLAGTGKSAVTRCTERNYTRPRIQSGILCIGVSTGGPPAVQSVLSQLPQNFPAPIVIAQHMPEAFTGPFAERLDRQTAIKVMELSETAKLEAGTAYICRGGKCIRIEARAGIPYGVIIDCPAGTIYKPSVNELMASVSSLGPRVLGVMLTGMGSDGLEGSKQLKARGGKLLAQSEETCVVYGMPKAIVDANLADEILAIDKIAGAILSYFC